MRLRFWIGAVAALFVVVPATPSLAQNLTLAESLPFSALGATGTVLPVTAEEILAGPTCTSGPCGGLGPTTFELGPTLYYRLELESGSLIAIMAAFPGLGLTAPDSGPVGYVADDDPATRRPSGVTTTSVAPYWKGPSFAFTGAVLAGERTEVLFRAYPVGTPSPPDDLASFRLQAQLGGPFATLGPVAIQPVPEPETLLLLAVGLVVVGFGQWRRRRGVL